MSVDTVTLTKVINQCFELSMDGQLPAAWRAKFLAHGKRLRGHLVNLLSAEFDEGSVAVVEANSRVRAVSAELANSAAVLANVAKTLSNIAQLAGTMDKLLNVAVTFL
jgi:hypothetical protein